MNWFTSLFSSGAAKLVDSLGTAIDELVTSDEERKKLKVALEKEMNGFKESQLAAMADYDKEITQRHANDMKSDSWLSKNIRPMTLAFLTIATVILAYLTIFLLDVKSVAMVEPWLDLLKVLLVTIYAFYFGSRGFEKVQAIKDGAKSK